ncbi:MAG: DUF1343 domain-containing protein [Deltaproteobacteria bacterium]|nr:DUF1343 domain-containing protein [Deltaproteobacteria bacterium]
MSRPRPVVRSGLDRVAAGDADALAPLTGRRVGLLCHAASVDAELRPARAVLEAAGVQVVALFGPEHGLRAAAQDMVGVASGETDLPVHSLYGERFEDLSPTPAQIAGLDALVVDLQDVGSRYYTYVWTAALCLVACAREGIPLVVLDRPNPLGGERVEGAPQRPGYRSFVGLYDVSVRHGMTIAELLRLVRARESLPEAALELVEMQGYARSMGFAATGLPWVLPSPNMPTLDTARVYPGACLLEGTTLSEGRGHTRPFEVWGAPWLDGERLARSLRGDPWLEGACLRPLHFSPTFHKHAGASCGGVQVHIVDVDAFRPYAAYLRMIEVAHGQCPAGTRFFRTEEYEYVADRPALDLLSGGPEVREALEAGTSLDPLLHADLEAAEAFRVSREPFLIYG